MVISSRRLHVFLCHSSNDKAVVRLIYKKLSEDGFAPWLDEKNLIGGQDWNLEIQSAVRKSDVVLVFLSGSSITKKAMCKTKSNMR